MLCVEAYAGSSCGVKSKCEWIVNVNCLGLVPSGAVENVCAGALCLRSRPNGVGQHVSSERFEDGICTWCRTIRPQRVGAGGKSERSLVTWRG